MKPLFRISVCLFTTVLLLFAKLSFGQKDFSKLSVSLDSLYGYNDQNPIKLKKGNQKKSIDNTYKFLSGLKTTDNQSLKLLFRETVDNSNYIEPIINIRNKYDGMPINGKLPFLDKYVFLTSNTKDTLKLYVDIYNKGELLVPVGLKYEAPKE